MKKLFLLSVVLLVFKSVSCAQITVAIPATQQMQAAAEPAKRTIAFRLSSFTEQILLPPNIGVPNSETEPGTQLNLTVKEFDLANSTSGSTFLAQEDGVYHLDVRLNFSFNLTDWDNYNTFFLMLNKNGVPMERTQMANPRTQVTPFYTLMICTSHLLKKGDRITASYNAQAQPGTGEASTWGVSFSGFKVN